MEYRIKSFLEDNLGGKKMLKFSYKNALNFFNEEEITLLKDQVNVAHNYLEEKNGPGVEFTGWTDLPVNYDKEEFARIKKAAEYIKETADVFVCVGIGGSYLGAQAVIDALSNHFSMALSKEERKAPQIIFCGNQISPSYLAELLDLVKDKEICLNVISKSGTTTEPAIAFRIFRNYMEEKYGKEESKKRIFVTTDKQKGALKELSNQEGYESFIVPDEVGGRYSVLTAVGLLPIAAAGINIDELMEGAASAMKEFSNTNLDENAAYQYAAVRNALYRKGYETEILVNYEPRLRNFSEWWKQLYGESEGKDNKGIFPASVNNTTDLHSMGQFIQEGKRNLMETVLWIESSHRSMEIPEDFANLDGLNYLAGKDMQEVNEKAMIGTVLAHVDGGVPNLQVSLNELSAFTLGELIYFYERACGVSAYLNAVNPFDQPGVEAYKKNMFALLGKAGFEAQKAELEAKL